MPYARPSSYELPFHSQSDTSRDAAVKAEKFVGKQGREVLDWFRSRGIVGATQREASEALGIARASMAARVHALEQQGKLRKTTARALGCFIYVAGGS